MEKLSGQIIALTKNIHFSPPDGENYGMAQFMAGKRDPFHFTGGIGISWWYRQNTFKILENVSFIIKKEIEEFSECDHETIQNIISITLQEICVDSRVFNGDDVCFGRKQNLFSCMQGANVSENARIIIDEIFLRIKNEIKKWCVIYTAPRIEGKSFTIESEGLHIVNKNDNEYWQYLLSKGYAMNDWNPITGNFNHGSSCAFSQYNYDYLFISESEGTSLGSKFASSLKFRKLFSVIFAVVNSKNSSHQHKVIADPYSMSLQFPHRDSERTSSNMSEIGELLPYYSHENILSDSEVSTIQNWYIQESAMDIEQRNRIGKCAHFINKGMNSNDIEAYIHLFVALDALYGKQHLVERSITEGVSGLPQTQLWSEKISWLFDLRNELVHGGSRYIKEWPKYMRYYKHFASEPTDDIKELSFQALLHAPANI